MNSPEKVPIHVPGAAGRKHTLRSITVGHVLMRPYNRPPIIDDFERYFIAIADEEVLAQIT